MNKPTQVRADSFLLFRFVLCALALAACEPLQPCRSEVQLGTTYHVSLAAKSSPALYAAGGNNHPSCTGLDRLESGFALDIAIPQDGPHPEYDRGHCWVPLGDITSDVGLPLVPVDRLPGIHPHFVTGPMFARSAKFSIGDCTGWWDFMAFDEPANAYDGTPARRWAARLASPDITPACQAAYPAIVTPSSSWCYDEWDVDLQVK